MPDSFYVPSDDGFVATALTRGPWDPSAQHGSPPAALLGRAIERHVVRSDLQVVRVTYDILRPIPVDTMTVATATRREGRSVWRVDAALSVGGDVVMSAAALLLRVTDLPLPSGVGGAAPPPGPDVGAAAPFFPVGWDEGYHTGMEFRFVQGSFLDPGPAVAWMRMRHPLVAGEVPSPLVRALMVADTGNGASSTLDFRRYMFVNPDLTVALHRHPDGEWVCLDASTAAEPTGVGLAVARLADQRGVLGAAMQSLYLAERGPRT